MGRLCRHGYLSDSESVVGRWLLVVRKTSSPRISSIFADNPKRRNEIPEDPCKSVAQNWLFTA